MSFKRVQIDFNEDVFTFDVIYTVLRPMQCSEFSQNVTGWFKFLQGRYFILQNQPIRIYEQFDFTIFFYFPVPRCS